MKVTKRNAHLNLSKLSNEAYQRDINGAKVKQIVQNFDERQLRPIVVSSRDGNFYVIDGQHRVVALRELKIPTIESEIYYGLTREEEALMFYQLNTNTRKSSPHESFNALLMADDEVARKVKEIASKYAFKIEKGARDNCIAAVTKIQSIYKKYGYSLLDMTLMICREAWNGDTECLQSKFLGGLAAFISIYQNDRNFSYRNAVDKFRKVSANVVLREANADGSTTSGDVQMMNVLRKYYNRGVKKNQLGNLHI